MQTERLCVRGGWQEIIWGFPQIRGAHFGGPHNKDYSILGSILGSPDFGNLQFKA